MSHAYSTGLFSLNVIECLDMALTQVTAGNIVVTDHGDVRVARGIFRTGRGWRLYVRVNGVLLARRLADPKHTTPLDELVRRRLAWSAALQRVRISRGVMPAMSRAAVRALLAKLPTRIASKILATGTCWTWTGGIAKGYGRVHFKGRVRQAHAVVYECCVGPVPVGTVLDHLCRVRRCVNPTHVEPVTNRINILRGDGYSATLARRKFCIEGHQLVRIGKRRFCPTCNPSGRAARLQIMPCACGCGQPLLPDVVASRQSRYLPFHGPAKR
jgi:hypothetical protein